MTVSLRRMKLWVTFTPATWIGSLKFKDTYVLPESLLQAEHLTQYVLLPLASSRPLSETDTQNIRSTKEHRVTSSRSANIFMP